MSMEETNKIKIKAIDEMPSDDKNSLFDYAKNPLVVYVDKSQIEAAYTHLYDDIITNPHVVRVVALSGGYSQEVANEKLKHIKGLIASFSRALLENLKYQQSEEEFNKTIGQSIDNIYSASVDKVL